jgi:hypothetical protein
VKKYKTALLAIFILLFTATASAASTIDKFNSGGIPEYSGDTSYAQESTKHSTEGVSALEVDEDGNYRVVYSTPGDGLPNYFDKGETVSVKFMSDGTANSHFLFGASGKRNAWLARIEHNQDRFRFVNDTEGQFNDVSLVDVTIDKNNWYTLNVTWYENGNISLNLYDGINGGINIVNIDSTAGYYQKGKGVGFGSNSGSNNCCTYYDDVWKEKDNVNPVINSNTSLPADPKLNDNVGAEANVTDSDGSVDSVNVSVWEGSTKIANSVQLTQNGDIWNKTGIFQADTANTAYTIQFNAVDDQGGTASSNYTFQIEDTAPDINLSKPTNTTYNSKSRTFNFTVSDADDVDSELHTWNSTNNNDKVANGTATDNFSIQETFTADEGSNQFNVNVTDANGNSNTSQVFFSVDTTPPDLTLHRPNNTEKRDDISINFTVSDADSSVDTCWYNFNGSNWTLPSCTNASTSSASIGDKTLTLYANDTGGNTGSTERNFTAYHTNEIRAKDDDTGNSLSKFTVTYDNISQTATFQSNNSKALFNTSDLPTGNNTLSIKKNGYSTTTSSQDVNDSYDINTTFKLEPAGFSFEARDETSDNLIHYNTTITNNTNSIEVNSVLTNNTTSTGYQTYIERSWFSADFVTISATEQDNDNYNEENCYRITLTYVNGTIKTIADCQGQFNVNDDVSIDDTLYRNIKVELFNNGSGSDQFNVDIEVRDKGKDGFSADYADLNKSLFPQGDLELRANNIDYRPRTYFTTFTSTKLIALTAYLLQESNGITITIETVDSSQTAISDVELTIQKAFGGNYKTVAQAKTASDGTAGFFLNPDFQYKVLASKSGYVNFEGSFTPSNYQFDPLTIQLSSESSFKYIPVWDTVSAKIAPFSNTVPNTTVNFTGSINDGDNELGIWGIKIRNGSNTLNSSSVSGSPSGGSVNLSANLSNFTTGRDITATLFFHRNGQRFTYNKTYKVSPIVVQGPNSLLQAMDDLRGKLSPFAQAILAIIVTLSVSTFVGGILGRKGSAPVALLTLAIFTHKQYINPFLLAVTIMTVAGVYMVRR